MVRPWQRQQRNHAKAGQQNPAPKAPKTADLPSWADLVRAGSWYLSRGLFYGTVGFLALVVIYAFLNPRLTPYLMAERFRQGGIERNWTAIGDMAPERGKVVRRGGGCGFLQPLGL